MRQTKFPWALGGLLLLILTSAASTALPAPEPRQFVQDLSDKVLAIFNNRQLSRDEKEKRMYPLAVNAFDVPRIARFVLGRFWKDTPEQQRDEFTRVFERYIVHIYTGRFVQVHDVDIRILDTRSESANATLVRTRIIRHDGGPPIPVDWWLRKSGDTYKIMDVLVEGVSEVVALREQFTSVINQHDGRVSALIEHLRAMTDQYPTISSR